MTRLDDSRPFIPLRIAILTMSDTRTLAEDRSGDALSTMATDPTGGYVESKHATLREALDAAHIVVGRLSENTCSKIVVQRHDGTLKTEWTYGRDPFPPRG